MKTRTIIFLMGYMLMLIDAMSAHAQTNPVVRDVNTMLQGLHQDLTNGSITRIEILYYPERIKTRADIKPAWMETNYLYKLEIRDMIGSKRIEKLSAALLDLNPSLPALYYDVRWAFLFYDVKNRKTHAIYYDRRKNGCIIDDQTFSTNAKFGAWLELNYQTCFE